MTTKTLLIGLLTATTLGFTLVPAAAEATTATHANCPEVIHGTAPTLHPEGVAYDPARDRFLVGSVTHGTVSVVNPDGTVRTLVHDDTLTTTMGIAVDAKRGRLLVANGDVGLNPAGSPDTLNKVAGLGVYDLRTGKRIAYHDLGALDPSHNHFANDIAIAPDGTAFVTDSFNGAIYRVPPHGDPKIEFQDDRLLPTGNGNGANGIVLHPGGYLLIAHSSGKALYKLEGGTLTQVRIAQPIGAPDGLLLNEDGTVNAIDNTAANRVIGLSTMDNWATASVGPDVAWPDPAPTTMARGKCGVYVLSGRLDQLPAGSDEFLLRKLG